MNDFECPGREICRVRDYCLALEAYGVVVGDESCDVSSMFNKGILDRSPNFDPKMTDGQKPDTLINSLGEAAYSLMSAEMPNERSTLIDLHQQSLDAQFNLWKTMLNAPKQGRKFTEQEKIFYESRIVDAQKNISNFQISGSEAIFALAGYDRKCLDEYGILFDSSMLSAVDRLVGNMMDGQPTMIVGDKGIAKTALAKFACWISAEQEPLIISAHGDMGTNELMGEVGLRDGKTYFKEGRIPQAAREGRPVIIDEVNIADVPVMLRLQDILLNIKPGSQLVLQEDGQDAITVRPGFAVIASANEASKRYIHRQTADPANRDRYDIIRFNYPDMPPKGQQPADILQRNVANLRRLAYAAISDHEGNLTGMSGEEVEKIVMLASATQLLYSQKPTSGLKRAVGLDESTTGLLDDEPIMSDCITPRRMYTELKRFAPKNKPGFTFEKLVTSMIERLDEGDQEHNSTIAEKLFAEINKK